MPKKESIREWLSRECRSSVCSFERRYAHQRSTYMTRDSFSFPLSRDNVNSATRRERGSKEGPRVAEETGRATESLLVSNFAGDVVGNRKYEAEPGGYGRSLRGSASESANNRRGIGQARAIYIRMRFSGGWPEPPSGGILAPGTAAVPSSPNFPICNYFVKRITIKWTSVKQTYTGRDVSVRKRLLRGRMFIRPSFDPLNTHRPMSAEIFAEFSTKSARLFQPRRLHCRKVNRWFVAVVDRAELFMRRRCRLNVEPREPRGSRGRAVTEKSLPHPRNLMDGGKEVELNLTLFGDVCFWELTGTWGTLFNRERVFRDPLPRATFLKEGENYLFICFIEVQYLLYVAV